MRLGFDAVRGYSIASVCICDRQHFVDGKWLCCTCYFKAKVLIIYTHLIYNLEMTVFLDKRETIL